VPLPRAPDAPIPAGGMPTTGRPGRVPVPGSPAATILPGNPPMSKWGFPPLNLSPLSH
jgi:hypothetical protein